MPSVTGRARLAAALLLAAGFFSGGCGGERTIGDRIDDTWIATKVRLHLVTYADLGRHARVETSTDKGVVILRGTVSTEAERSEAERVVRQVVGVGEVVNELTVVPPPPEEPRPRGGTTY